MLLLLTYPVILLLQVQYLSLSVVSLHLVVTSLSGEVPQITHVPTDKVKTGVFSVIPGDFRRYNLSISSRAAGVFMFSLVTLLGHCCCRSQEKIWVSTRKTKESVQRLKSAKVWSLTIEGGGGGPKQFLIQV